MTNNFIIKKTILVISSVFGVAAFLYLSTSIPNHIASEESEPAVFRFEITGHESDKIYAEFITDDETHKVTETLPTTLTYDASTIEFKVASLNDNQEPLSITVFRDNQIILSSSGEGIYGKVVFISTHYNKITTNSIGNMKTEDIQSLIASMPQ